MDRYNSFSISEESNNSKSKILYITPLVIILLLILFYCYQIVIGAIFYNEVCDADNLSLGKLNLAYGIIGAVLFSSLFYEVFLMYKERSIEVHDKTQIQRRILIGMLLFLMCVTSLTFDLAVYINVGKYTCGAIITVLSLIRSIIDIVYFTLLLAEGVYNWYCRR